jgi:hypothetical protein
MNTRADKPKEYFAKLLDVTDEEINYSEVPPTTASDWENAEVLLPVTVEEFQAIRQFIRRRREHNGPSPSAGGG